MPVPIELRIVNPQAAKVGRSFLPSQLPLQTPPPRPLTPHTTHQFHRSGTTIFIPSSVDLGLCRRLQPERCTLVSVSLLYITTLAWPPNLSFSSAWHQVGGIVWGKKGPPSFQKQSHATRTQVGPNSSILLVVYIPCHLFDFTTQRAPCGIRSAPIAGSSIHLNQP